MVDLGVTAAQMAILIGAQAVALATPGPALISITQKAIAQGRGPALRYGMGLGLGANTWVLAAILGLGLVLHRWPAILTAMTLLGGVYLIYVAVQTWRGADAALDMGAQKMGGFWAGYLLNVSNPKPILFITSLFLSVFPEPFTLTTGALVLGVMVTIELSFFVLVSLTLTTPAIRTRALAAKPIIDRTAAVVIAGLGMWLLWGLAR